MSKLVHDAQVCPVGNPEEFGRFLIKWPIAVLTLIQCLMLLVMQDPSKTFLTTTNVNQGTAMYMAPEQFNGTRLDEK